MKKVVTFVALLFVACMFLTACAPAATATSAAVEPTTAPAVEQATSAPEATTAPAAEKKEYNIAVIRWDPNDIYFNGVQLGQEMERDRIQTEEGVTINFNVFGANDAAKQVTALQQMMDTGIDGVLISPWRGEAMVSLVEDLNTRGIPVVAHNNAIPGGKSAFVAMDNFAAGEGAAKYVVQRLEEVRGADWAKTEGGVLVELRCIVTISADIGRHDGYHSVFDPILAENKNLTWETTEAGCDGAKARKYVDDMISRYGDKIMAIVSIDGTMGVGGAVPALDAQSMLVPPEDAKHIVIATVDGTQVELQAINKGDTDVSFVQPAVGEGITSMHVLWDMIKNGGAQMDTPTADSDYLTGDEPWEPVVETSGASLGFEGPWFKLQTYGVPVDRKVEDKSNWGNLIYVDQNGSDPVYDGNYGK
ncbi:monosaccharide ABC transporter substrate-binding protein, CUT2 family [Longilinea arvoryzae]|uniref:Monosaccharide ABC transporter substrate-binding protein, CUT2 family n=1 Tax=Longilinea arvoryzae TaxID=360412 RepID=A0A0S7BM51_9CHLR|nr:sugar ABC transporter substrate-binding protein [Longilinea arvoryzae]GAP15763.1 monosaccharide ABC transporter substrate-binding protein, CUT2 family [Longilinea arvoryzae]